MREIGSEFWDVPTTNNGNDYFPESIQWFLSGRSALQAIIKVLGGVRSVSLPSWCCDSMIKPFLNSGIDIHFYPVYWQKGLIQEIDLNSDALLLIDYFGHTSSSPDLGNYKGIIIRDVTHSIFSSGYSDADYYFGSLRKWCGVWTGGYAWTKDGRNLPMKHEDDFGYVPLREKAMQLKNSYIHGWGVNDKAYLGIYEKAEEALEEVGIAPANYRDVELAKRIDIKFVMDRRRKNAEVLRAAFTDWLVLPRISPTDTPMFVPVLVPDGKRNELRRYLIEHEIYCPIHWPVSELHRVDPRTSFIYENELSLVCDQRYNENDMNRMVETIKVFMEA